MADNGPDATYFTTYQAVVGVEMCDHLGHMNVQYYARAFGDAAFAVMNRLGLGRKAIEERRMALVAAQMNISYRAELRAGSTIINRSAVVDPRGSKVRFLHRLSDLESDTLAAEADVLSICVDLDRRRSMPIPDDILKRIDALNQGSTA